MRKLIIWFGFVPLGTTLAASPGVHFSVREHQEAWFQKAQIYPNLRPGGPGGGTGDGPCYDEAKKVLDACLKTAEAGGSAAAGEICRLTYAAQVSECDRQMGD